MRKRGIIFALLLILIMNVFLVSASLTVGETSHFVSQSYGPGSYLEGWINISLEDEPVSNLFEDNIENSISVIDLFRSDSLLTKTVDYSCVPSGCGSAYNASNGESSKSIQVGEGESGILGFRISSSGGAGLIDNINSVSFNITSDAPQSCDSQLSIDFFADGIIDTGNTNKGTGTCSEKKDYGCFETGKTTELNIMDGEPNMYCQKVNLIASPGFKLGAWMDVDAGAEETFIGLRDIVTFEEIESCSLGEAIGEGEKTCNISFLVTEPTEYYLCIYNDEGEDLNTKIRGYSTTDGCGFYTNTGLFEEETQAYEMFVEGEKFGTIGNLGIKEDFPFPQGLSLMFFDYVYNTYENECLNGCVIPIKFNSAVNQNITVSNVEIRYNAPSPKIENKVYDVELADAVLSTSNFTQVSLNNANLSLGDEFAGFEYLFKLGGETILAEMVYIEEVPMILGLNTLKAFTRFETNFRAIVEPVNDSIIESYSWKFGGDAPETTVEPSISHTFLTTGIVPLTISATDDYGRTGSKTFNIEVGSFEVLLLQELKDAIEDLANISLKLEAFPQFHQDGLAEVIDINALKREVTALDDRYDIALTDNDYASIADDFLGLEVPKDLVETSKTDLVPFYPNRDIVDVEVVADTFAEQYNASSDVMYKDGVVSWDAENLDTRVKYTQIGAEFDDRTDPLLSVFELKIRKTGSTSTPSSLFIRQVDGLRFDKSYNENVKDGFIEIPLKLSDLTVTFSTTEDLDITNLPAFISPALSELGVITYEYAEVEEPGIRWALYLLILFFLVIAGVTIYIFLQHWYKTKYETYLFKNRNFLFNLIHFIDAQKKKGIKEKEIFSKLRKAGWNSEQVNYVMKKYGGKRTGMLEIPIEKILNIFKKKQAEKQMAAKGMGMPMNRPVPRGVAPGVRPMPGRFSKRFYPK